MVETETKSITRKIKVEKVYCDKCGKLIEEYQDDSIINRKEVGDLRIQLISNDSCIYFQMKDICKNCTSSISDQIEFYLKQLGFSYV